MKGKYSLHVRMFYTILKVIIYFRGTWINYFDTQWMLGQDIAGSTIGIVGLGNIGQTIAKRLKGGFDVNRILYTGHREKPEGITKFMNIDNAVY